MKIQAITIAPMLLVLGWSGCALAVFWAFHDELVAFQRAHPALARIALGCLLAVVGGAVLVAQQPVVNECTEAFLRTICGNYWWECGWAALCWIMPG